MSYRYTIEYRGYMIAKSRDDNWCTIYDKANRIIGQEVDAKWSKVRVDEEIDAASAAPPLTEQGR